MTKPVNSYGKKTFGKMQVTQRIKLSEADDKKECSKVKPTITEYQPRLPFIIYLYSLVKCSSWQALLSVDLNGLVQIEQLVVLSIFSIILGLAVS